MNQNENGEIEEAKDAPEVSTQTKLNQLLADFAAFDDAMRESTRLRREKDEQKLAELRQEITCLEEKLGGRVMQREETTQRLKQYCDDQVEQMSGQFEELIKTRAEQTQERLDQLAADIQKLDEAVEDQKKELPRMIEERTNDLTQRLNDFMDVFDAEVKRRSEQEDMMQKRLTDHEVAVTDEFDRERRDREIKYTALKDALDAYTATRVRGDDRFAVFAKEESKRLHAAIAAESDAREREDDEILEALHRYTAKIQDSLKVIAGPGD